MGAGEGAHVAFWVARVGVPQRRMVRSVPAAPWVSAGVGRVGGWQWSVLVMVSYWGVLFGTPVAGDYFGSRGNHFLGHLLAVRVVMVSGAWPCPCVGVIAWPSDSRLVHSLGISGGQRFQRLHLVGGWVGVGITRCGQGQTW